MTPEKKVWYLLCAGFTAAIFAILVTIALIIANQFASMKTAYGVGIPAGLAIIFLTVSYHKMKETETPIEADA